MVLWGEVCGPVGGQNVPRGPPPKHTEVCGSHTAQMWLHPRITKMNTHMLPHTGRGRALPIQPQNSPRAQHPRQLPCPAPHTLGPLLLKLAGDAPYSQVRTGREGSVVSEELQPSAQDCENPSAPGSVPGTWDPLGFTPPTMVSVRSLAPKPTSFLPAMPLQ